MLRQRIATCVVAAIIGGLTFAQTVSAETFDCSLTGYTFMGGGSAYVSTPTSHAKTYFLAQPLNYHMGDPPANMWGYGWIKFNDIGDSTLESARLYFDLLGVGAMGTTPASPTNPAVLDIYSAGSIDVADLVGGGTEEEDWDLRTTLRDNLDASSPLCTITMTSNGDHYIDITDLYNSWVTGGEAVNNGLVFAAADEGVGSKYASFGNSTGDPPYIVIVPEPGTIVLVAGAFLGLGLARILRRRRIADVMA